MFYIGITGHRGAGKTAIAYLLGNTLECLKRNNTFEDIQVVFNEKCSIIRANNNAIYDCDMDGETIKTVQVVGGCNGNLKGICNILKNKTP